MLFDDNRFSIQNGWTSGYLCSFIKKVKKIDNFKLNKYEYGSKKNLKFNYNENEEFIFVHSKKDGEARDLVRHIRNGIAHGNVQFIRIKNKELLKIVDYGKNLEQTAYIIISFEQLKSIYDVYIEVKKSKENNRKNNNKVKEKRK